MKNITWPKLSLRINEIRPDTCLTCLLKMQTLSNWNLRCVITENQWKILLVSHTRVSRFQGVKKFHLLVRMGCYCTIIVFSSLKPYIPYYQQLVPLFCPMQSH